MCDLLKQPILGEWNTLAGKRQFKVCLMVSPKGFMLHNSDGKSVLIDRMKAVAWLRSNSDIKKIDQAIEKYLPEYYN